MYSFLNFPNTSLVAQTVKNLPAGDLYWISGLKRSWRRESSSCLLVVIAGECFIEEDEKKKIDLYN